MASISKTFNTLQVDDVNSAAGTLQDLGGIKQATRFVINHASSIQSLDFTCERPLWCKEKFFNKKQTVLQR